MNDAEMAAGLAATPNYRYADRVGAQLFVAGQVPLDADGRLVGLGSADAQTTACLKNLHTLIAVHGFKSSDIRHITVYVVGEPSALQSAWAAVTDYFNQSSPPATLLGVSRLGHAGQLVEIDATIVANSAS